MTSNGNYEKRWKIIDGDSQEFMTRLSHQTIREIDRKGKYLIFLLDYV